MVKYLIDWLKDVWGFADQKFYYPGKKFEWISVNIKENHIVFHPYSFQLSRKHFFPIPKSIKYYTLFLIGLLYIFYFTFYSVLLKKYYKIYSNKIDAENPLLIKK